MQLSQLKLELIQKIIDTNDPKILNLVKEVINLPQNSNTVESTSNQLTQLLDPQESGPLDEDTQDLQNSINDFFNPNS